MLYTTADKSVVACLIIGGISGFFAAVVDSGILSGFAKKYTGSSQQVFAALNKLTTHPQPGT
ncbi:MAG: hypothetical protein BWY67_01168 [Bacteroidetes bacterium ADurb.Bin397]|nr:MAG: hypothetical protein BWY67_01168 [Bacteroidetes bacterium ADurb.Bin397]